MPNTKVISVDTLQRFYNNSISAIQHKGGGTISIGQFYSIGGNISYNANSHLLTDQIFSAKQWWSMDAYPIVQYPLNGDTITCFMVNSKMTVDMGGFTMSWLDNPLSLLWCFINLQDSFGTYDADIKMYFAFPKDPTQQIEVHLVFTAGSLASNTAQIITVGSGGGGADLTVIADEFDTTPTVVPNEYYSGDKVVYEDTPYQSTMDNNTNTPDSGTGWTTLTYTTMNSGGMVNTLGAIVKSGTTGKFYECTSAYSWFDPSSPNAGSFDQISDYEATTQGYHQYSIGDYCIYNDSLYKCISPTTGASWSSYDWQETQVMDEIGSGGGGGGGSTPAFTVLGSFTNDNYTPANWSTIVNSSDYNHKIVVDFGGVGIMHPIYTAASDEDTSAPILEPIEKVLKDLVDGQYSTQVIDIVLELAKPNANTRYRVMLIIDGSDLTLYANQGQVVPL